MGSTTKSDLEDCNLLSLEFCNWHKFSSLYLVSLCRLDEGLRVSYVQEADPEKLQPMVALSDVNGPNRTLVGHLMLQRSFPEPAVRCSNNICATAEAGKAKLRFTSVSL